MRTKVQDWGECSSGKILTLYPSNKLTLQCQSGIWWDLRRESQWLQEKFLATFMILKRSPLKEQSSKITLPSGSEEKWIFVMLEHEGEIRTPTPLLLCVPEHQNVLPDHSFPHWINSSLVVTWVSCSSIMSCLLSFMYLRTLQRNNGSLSPFTLSEDIEIAIVSFKIGVEGLLSHRLVFLLSDFDSQA